MMIAEKLLSCCVGAAGDAGVSPSALLSFASLPAGPVSVDAYGNPVATACASTGSGINCAGQSISINVADTEIYDDSNWLLEIWTADAVIPDVLAGPFRLVGGIAEYYGADGALLITSSAITPSAGANHIAIGVQAGRARLWHNGISILYAPGIGLLGEVTHIDVGPFSGTLTDIRVSNTNVYGLVWNFAISPHPSPLGIV